MNETAKRQVKEILIRMAIAGAPWRETGASSMLSFDIDPEEIEREALRRQPIEDVEREALRRKAIEAAESDALPLKTIDEVNLSASVEVDHRTSELRSPIQARPVSTVPPPVQKYSAIESSHVREYADRLHGETLNRSQSRWQTEAVINRRYEALGLNAPHIVWCEGPLQFEKFPLLLLYFAHERQDKKKRSQTWYKLTRSKPWKLSEPESRFWARLEELLDLQVDLDWFGHWLDITNFLEQDLFTSLSEQSDELWSRSDKEIVERTSLRRLADRLQRTRNVAEFIEREASASLRYAFAVAFEETRAKVDVCEMDELHRHLARASPNGVTGAWQIFWLANFDYLRALRGILYDAESTARLDDGLALFRGAFKLLSFSKVCFVLEHPISAHFNDANRIHDADGPAVLFSDGSAGYVWHGTSVPSVQFLNKHRLTINAIEKEQNLELRRILIEIFGWERYLKAPTKGPKGKGFEKIAEDECGVLYRKETGPSMDPIVAVEVVNSTPEPDGTFKRYMIRVDPGCSTARSAVAWTFGLRSSEYKPSVES